MRGWILKLFGLMASTMIMCLGVVPVHVQKASVIACAFIALDTITGVATALCCKEASSRTMKNRLIAKAAQYSLLIGLAVGVTYLLSVWTPVEGALAAIVSIETLSMMENLTRLERCGGVNMGPAGPILRRLSGLLQTPDTRTASKDGDGVDRPAD